MIEMTVPSGAGGNPHAHQHIHETFYVLEGEITFQTETGNFIAQAGAFVIIPKGGMIHRFKNKTENSAKLLCTVLPAGLDDCFIEANDYLLSKPNDSEIDKKMNLSTIAKKYGNQLYPVDYFE